MELVNCFPPCLKNQNTNNFLTFAPSASSATFQPLTTFPPLTSVLNSLAHWNILSYKCSTMFSHLPPTQPPAFRTFPFLIHLHEILFSVISTPADPTWNLPTQRHDISIAPQRQVFDNGCYKYPHLSYDTTPSQCYLNASHHSKVDLQYIYLLQISDG